MADEKTVEYTRHMPFWLYLLLMGLLVVVDWIANVSVFRELLPKDVGSSVAWQNLVAKAEISRQWAGIIKLFDRIAFAPDVSILAFGVVLFLMILAHGLGSSVRRYIALRCQEELDGQRTLRSESSSRNFQSHSVL